MTVSAISHYRGGTIDVVVPLAKRLKAAYLKHGVAYRLSRLETGPNVADWFVVVHSADQTAYEKAQAAIAQDPECQPFAEIAKFAKRISRELVIDLVFDTAGFAALVRKAVAVASADISNAVRRWH